MGCGTSGDGKLDQRGTAPVASTNLGNGSASGTQLAMSGKFQGLTPSPSQAGATWKSEELPTMKIFVGQIYIKPGITFPFSLQFQRWLGDALTERVEASEQFCKAYGANFALGLRISAKEEISEPEIKGPTVFKRNRNVEFTIFCRLEL
jgi:hypothetical protein